MTALTTPTTRPAPTRRSSTVDLVRWLVRLHRPALLVWVGLVLVLGGLLLWLGGPLTDASADAWKQYDACRTSSCHYDQDAIGRYKDWYTYTTVAVLVLPFVVAAWSGAALIGRELERGTAQLAWTQSISPARWLAAKLTAPAALVAVGSGLLVALHHWAWSAGQGRIDTAKRWYDTGTYAANGTIVVALALAGLAAGALIGLARREALSSLVGGLGATGILWAAIDRVTPHLWPTVTHVSGLSHERPTGNGISVTQGLLTSTGARIHNPDCGSVTYLPCKDVYAKLDAVSYFNDYHPQSHYWPLQLTSTAIFLAVAAALTVAAFQILQRRTVSAPARKESAV
ncbi:ABC transporter permease [Streptomyces sp. NPDC005538]|uniref:ABC transporter permease n=1 Tax=unclassified Streptomyces TaxID=2593676 RepID=UPI0033A7C23D